MQSMQTVDMISNRLSEWGYLIDVALDGRIPEYCRDWIGLRFNCREIHIQVISFVAIRV